MTVVGPAITVRYTSSRELRIHAPRHPRGDLSSRREPKLREDPFHMAIRGALCDDQPLRDLAVRQAVLDEGGHFKFPLRQRLRDCAAPGPVGVRLGAEPEVDHVIEISEDRKSTRLNSSHPS